MTPLPALGWRPELAAQLPAGTAPARVVRVDRGRLGVLTGDGERRVHPGAGLYADAALGGPAVGDWVALRDELAVALLPRTSAFVRTGAGRSSAAQVVAANLDLVLVVDALTADPRLRRVERYLAVAWSSGATPVVVLTKADLCDDVVAGVEAVREDALGVDVLAVSSPTGEGIAALRALLAPGRTAAMVGPSGVGKSSLLNALAGEPVAGTREIREDGRGRHTTTARELQLLPGGALLIDTPGMRELALYDDAAGVEAAYADVADLALDCRFRDCAHGGEPGCGVAAALDDGRLDPARFRGWRKLQAEAHRQRLRVDARARAEERARLRSLHRSRRDLPSRPR
ncbi:ribosome small subunit-dependent GTPase A [Blastococcus goldschmidtiae]|uniref:Small ribosomal subunit biogenesis GTPase RsgA n=1 Tax=Blastococcus goldschmidtiae TaxID=3075546 RepID=A0ABU2K3G3_9ACTN|nr:ribosome small subunit-dependent GTPase A [Blastococcus sp. DSM 46792]MDT0274704.1 ribosome small subunit-dependent GTPase A [Blastococcus sp. DSM 46792]